MKYLKELGFIILHNEHAMVQSHERPDDYFYMAGTDDIKADTIGYVQGIQYATKDFCPHALISTPKRPKNVVRIAIFPSATFGPLFSFHCPLFVTKNNNLEWKSSRFAAVDRRSVADKQLHLNGVIHSAGVAPRAQPENVVHSGMQRSRFKPRAGNNIFFIFIVSD